MALGIQKTGVALLQNVDNLDFIDIKRFMAKYGADLSFGQGIVIKSDNEQIAKYLEKLMKDNRFDDLMINIAEETNYWGRVVLTIDKTETGDFILSFATPELLQNIEKIEITPFYAKLLIRKIVGLQVFFMNVKYTTTEIFRSWTVQDRFGIETEYNQGEHGKLPRELAVPAYEKHNLGFIPFVEFTNKPARNLILGAQQDFSRLADDYSVRNLPIHINSGLRQMLKEEIIGKSRIAGNIPASEIKKRGGSENIITADSIFETEAMGTTNQAVSVMASSYDGMKRLEPQKQKINMYAKGCGYSEIFASENTQTEAETLYSKDFNQRTTKAKRRRYMELLMDLFKKILVYKGLMQSLDDEPDFTIEIKENVVYNQLQLTQFLKEAMEGAYPLLTHAEAIAMARDIDDPEQAEKIAKELKQQAEENEQREAMLYNENENKDNLGKAGSGKDPDTDKEE